MPVKVTISDVKRTVPIHAPIDITDRGFADFANFEDTYGVNVLVRESSADPLDKVWVFIHGGQTSNNKAAAHLNREQAEKLAVALLSWVADQDMKEKDTGGERA